MKGDIRDVFLKTNVKAKGKLVIEARVKIEPGDRCNLEVVVKCKR